MFISVVFDELFDVAVKVLIEIEVTVVVVVFVVVVIVVVNVVFFEVVNDAADIELIGVV